MGEAYLVAFLQVLVDKLARREVFKYFGLIKGVDQKLQKWTATLSAIGAVLNEAEERQLITESKPLKLWLDDLRDLAYDVEDVLDKYATKMLKRKILMEHHASTATRVWNSVPNGVFNYKMNSEIQKITERLQEISHRKDQLSLNIITGTTSSTKARQNLPPSSSQPDGPVIGRDEDKRRVVEFLSKQELHAVNFDVVAIVGMAGIGKTTLAAQMFNEINATQQFKPTAWVCVSDDFNLERVTKQILEAVTSQHYPTEDFNQVQQYLHKELAGKKFLIVLDDVWGTCSYGLWMKLQSPFRDGAAGSKIIVTTRDAEVSKMMGAGTLVHNLERMSNDVCFKVFEQHAFRNVNRDIPPNFESLKEKIVARCSGLPLAARTLGGLLLRKEMNEWEEILNNKLWSLSNERDILPVLRLSYHYLPSHLKRCFAYCSILPNDYEFREHQLILLWMAEGLIQPQPEHNKQMEDLGTDYFQELLSRSLFQKSNKNNSKYVMHDLVVGLAQWAAGDICFRLEDKQSSDHVQLGCFPNARHASYICGDYDVVKKFEALSKVKHLRTFLPLSHGYPFYYLSRTVTFDLLPKLQSLRVLSLNGYQVTELPNSIGELKYMRYLDLSYTLITCLPESTTSLYNLQTLILEGCYALKALPINLRNLVNLRHLNKQVDVLSINGCKGVVLTSAVDFELLESLQLSYISELRFHTREFAKGITKVTDLKIGGCEELTSSLLKNEDRVLHQLISLKYLELSKCESLSKVAKGLHHLTALQELRIFGCSSLVSFPDGVLPHSLKVIEIEMCDSLMYFAKYQIPPNIKIIEIKECKSLKSLVEEEEVVPISCSSSSHNCLEHLDIRECEALKSLSLRGKLFPTSLKHLEIYKCVQLQLITSDGFSHDNTNCLEEIRIECCPNLKSLPEGICHLTSLQMLYINDCASLVSIPRLSGDLPLPTTACNLRQIYITNCDKLVLPDMHSFNSLQKMNIDYHEDLQFTCFPPNLTSLSIWRIKNCKLLWELLHRLTSLTELWINGEDPNVVSFPPEKGKEMEMLLPKSLTSLIILGFPNLKKLSSSGFQHLTSLQSLRLFECPKLEFIPEDGLPLSLTGLHIFECPLLKEKCQPGSKGGRYWPKISHIPCIKIDYKRI